MTRDKGQVFMARKVSELHLVGEESKTGMYCDVGFTEGKD